MARRVKEKNSDGNVVSMDTAVLKKFDKEYADLDERRREIGGELGSHVKNFGSDYPKFNPKAYRFVRGLIRQDIEKRSRFWRDVNDLIAELDVQFQEELDLEAA